MADERVRINDLPEDATPSPDDNVAIDRANTRRTTVKQLVAAALPIATEPQAREGLIDTVAMTPLKTAQAIETLGSVRFASAGQGNLAATAVQPARTIAAGAGLTGGGDLSANRTIALSEVSIASLVKANTAVQPDRAITAGTGLAGGGTLADNISLALSSTSLASLALADTSVQPARKLSAGAGLTGGGDFSADRTVALNAASIASLGKADTAVQPARKIGAGAGLTGGGDFSADRIVALSDASIASLALADNAVPKARTVTVDTGLAGGGALSANITVSLSPSTQASLAKADSAVQAADIENFATKAELNAGLGTKLNSGAQAADSAKLQGYTAVTLPISTAAQAALDGKATTAQGSLADSAVQPDDLGALADKDTITTADITATGSTSSGALLTRGGVWVDPTGGGDMFRATYDPTNKAADAFSMGSMAETATEKVMTDLERAAIAANTGARHSHSNKAVLDATTASYLAAEKAKLAGIPADADKTPALAAVATTGDYSDLENKPSIPPAQVQSDWNAPSGVSAIQNKPALGTASAQNVEAFATAAQGAKADKAVRFDAQALTAQEQGQARENIDAGVLSGFRNKLINGGFMVAARGVTFTINSMQAAYTADRWAVYNGTNAQLTVDVVNDGISENYLVLRFTSSPTTGTVTVTQSVEDVRTLAGGDATLTYSVFLENGMRVYNYAEQNFGAGASPKVVKEISNTIESAAPDFIKISKLFTLDAVAGKTAVLRESNLKIGLQFHPRNEGVIILKRISLVAGDATAENDPFVSTPIQITQTLCQRFYATVGRLEMFVQGGHAIENTARLGRAYLPVRMRVQPSIFITAAPEYNVKPNIFAISSGEGASFDGFVREAGNWGWLENITFDAEYPL